MLSTMDFVAFIIPVIMIYWLHAGLSIGEILLLQGIFALVMLMAEVPTGALSDSWLGRKRTEILGSTLSALGFLLYVFSTRFIDFVVVESILGLAVAVKSGNSAALLHDGLEERGKIASFNRVVSLTSSISFLTAATAAILGGFIALVDIHLPFIILTAIESSIALYILLTIKEPRRKRARTARHATIKASKLLFQEKTLMILTIYSISTGVLAIIVFWTYQPLLLDIGQFRSLEMGFTFASLNVVAAASAHLRYHGNERWKNSWILSLLLFMGMVLTMFLAMTRNLIVILVIIHGFQIIRGVSKPHVVNAMQERLTSEERCTFTSMDSFKNGALYFLVALFLRDASVTTILKIAFWGYFLLFLIISILLLSFKMLSNESSQGG